MKKGWLGIWAWRAATVFASIVALVLGLRVLQSERQPDLAPWHTWAPREMDIGEMNEADWPTWLAREDALFRDVETHMRAAIDASERIP